MDDGVLGTRQRTCRFLKGRYMFVCSASHAYVPSEFELMEYCRDPRHTMCPRYMELCNAAAPAGVRLDEKAPGTMLPTGGSG